MEFNSSGAIDEVSGVISLRYNLYLLLIITIHARPLYQTSETNVQFFLRVTCFFLGHSPSPPPPPPPLPPSRYNSKYTLSRHNFFGPGEEVFVPLLVLPILIY